MVDFTSFSIQSWKLGKWIITYTYNKNIYIPLTTVVWEFSSFDIFKSIRRSYKRLRTPRDHIFILWEQSAPLIKTIEWTHALISGIKMKSVVVPFRFHPPLGGRAWSGSLAHFHYPSWPPQQRPECTARPSGESRRPLLWNKWNMSNMMSLVPV